jgi:glyoxylase-like metal-dependent hydrolase (beta-lactamase superfamily II)
MLVDTLMDVDSTQEMLDDMKKAAPMAAEVIDTLVITHSDGDHYWGNQLLKDAEIVCTKACARLMQEFLPHDYINLVANASTMGDLGEFLVQGFSGFRIEGMNPLPATRTFEKNLNLSVGSKEVQLIDVGPAHTEGDTIVYVPEQKVAFAADLLMIGSTPLMWSGPVDNWISACDLLLGLDVEIIVPGHGPITDKKGVESTKRYWEFMKDKSRKCFDAGMSVDETVAEIDLGEFSNWTESERVVINVNRLFAEFRGDESPPDVFKLLGDMVAMKKNADSQ